jgi:predicted AAA+ superfamily ATPase
MLTTSTIQQVIDSQRERLLQLDTGLNRVIPDYSGVTTHALIITGIRRCGKSTLLRQIDKTFAEPTLYLNFEDPRLAGFDFGDFNRLQEIIVSRAIHVLFFDEIQNIGKWEAFIRFRLDEGYRIFITGSNASMLSRELGTKLTGRHLSTELFPFSYSEFLEYTGKGNTPGSLGLYLSGGGFPEMIKTGMPEVLMHVFNDIVVRDIAMRHGIKNTSVLQQLAVWLISNTGKLITGNSLRKIFPIGSSSSIMEYLSGFADAYLFFFVPKFSYSQKVQLVNPKKVYASDTGLVYANSVSFSDDKGRALENLVFLQLRRRFRDIYYFSEKKECDFVVFQKSKKPELIQVCFELGTDNLDRELEGITEAMEFFGVQKGTVITYDQTDTFIKDRRKIDAVPFYRWAGSVRLRAVSS